MRVGDVVSLVTMLKSRRMGSYLNGGHDVVDTLWNPMAGLPQSYLRTVLPYNVSSQTELMVEPGCLATFDVSNGFHTSKNFWSLLQCLLDSKQKLM